ncbi:MAG: TonB-dependent receptor [Bacteroidales bacterium]|nr:TonB-dependent receptor [Bacteroidales bacterium]
MKIQVLTLIICFFLSANLWAQKEQKKLEGKVTEFKNGNVTSLTGANVYWQGTTVGATSDLEGKFTIERVPETKQLIVSYIGYQNDTIDTDGMDFLEVQLSENIELKEVKVVKRNKSTYISYIDPIKVEKIGEKELLKAACCNLSESFETSPSVDVSFTDAVTGTRQIQLLGLAGPYTQITRENMPDIRGLSAIYGLTFVPGTWIESIQLNKGTGSVVNGYEGITGQINMELRKPESADRLYLNGYTNEEGRMELNLNVAHKFKGDQLSTAVLLHAKDNTIKWDRNSDGFLDHPLGRNLIALNRWKYVSQNGLQIQLGMKGTYIDNLGGQVDFNHEGYDPSAGIWGMHLNLKRMEAFTKIGKVYEDKPWRSMGLQVSGSVYEQDSYFGLNTYDAGQNTFYSNFIYQDIFGNTDHKFRTGVSFIADEYTEQLNDTSYDRTEMVPGAYFEYTYSHLDKFNAVAGIRGDYHNLYGPFITPRLHLRYAITSKTVFRASAGRGQRTANIFSENNGLFASSRQFIVHSDGNNKPYGLKPEVAWNYGINLTQNFKLDYREGSISFDFYRTDFENQVVIDLDQDPQQVHFYNLEGKSYSKSFQAQVDYELIKRLDVRLAYRWYDVKTTYHGELLEKPLVARHRAFINLAYTTRKYWNFDYTLNWQGQKRIPFTGSNPEEYQLDDFSPSFILMNAQISKTWREKYELYAGIENLLDYVQKDPILSSNQPFGPYFDSSLIWGPIFGRNIYVGFRLKIK